MSVDEAQQDAVPDAREALLTALQVYSPPAAAASEVVLRIAESAGESDVQLELEILGLLPEDLIREIARWIDEGTVSPTFESALLGYWEAAKNFSVWRSPNKVAVVARWISWIGLALTSALLLVVIVLVVARIFTDLYVSIGPFVLLAIGTGATAATANSTRSITVSRFARANDLEQAPAEASRTSRSLNEIVNGALIPDVIAQMSGFVFGDPDLDVINVTVTPNLSSRIEGKSRVQTLTYRRVLSGLQRTGGATIGIAGERGSGKSELLRAFCLDRSEPEASKPDTVGVLVPAPVAYEPAAFLRLIGRRLAQETPGLADEEARRESVRSLLRTTRLLLVGGVLALAGWALRLHSDNHLPTTEDVGVFLLVASVWCALLWIVLLYVRHTPDMVRLYLALIHRLVSDSQSKKWAERRTNGWLAPFTAALNDEEISLLVERRRRDREARAEARQLLRRIAYVESKKLTAGADGKGGPITIKGGWERQLTEIPLSEADLVAQISSLAQKIDECGARIVIGIDELDKLESSEEAEKFMNSIKALFPIRQCSFLVTISESAAAKFASHGLSMRNVFDSSLDDVVSAEPLELRECRSLLRKRSEILSDLQVLLCYWLSGGLPRELLRAARTLGQRNYELGGNQPLHQVHDAVLWASVEEQVSGILLEARAHPASSAKADLVADLNVLLDSSISEWPDFLRTFSRNDPDFMKQVMRGSAELNSPSKDPKGITRPDSESDWARGARRQLAAFVYFCISTRDAVREGGVPTEIQAGDASAISRYAWPLAQARRQMEVDLSAGWRATYFARARLGLRVLDLVGATEPAGSP